MSPVQNIPDVPGQKDTKTPGALLLFKENCLSMFHLIKNIPLIDPMKEQSVHLLILEDSKETCLK